jgi:hypothetical protein
VPSGEVDRTTTDGFPDTKFGGEACRRRRRVSRFAPALPKNEGRIEALFLIYFIALLVQALIECELRRAMLQRDISELPLYPEERTTGRPIAEKILRLVPRYLRSRRTLAERQGD